MEDVVRVLSTLALMGAVRGLAGRYQAAGGARIDADFAPTLGLLDRLQGGETADVVILTKQALDDLAAEGRVVAASCVDRILKCEKRPIFQYRRRPSTSGRQSQNRQGDRRDNPTVIACERGRGDRVSWQMSVLGTKRTSRDVRSLVAIGGKRTWRLRAPTSEFDSTLS